MALKRDGTFVVWTVNNFRPTAVPAGLSNVVAVASGDFNVLAIVQPLAYQPVLLSPKISGGNLIFSWPAIPGRTYRLQYKPSLDETLWTELPRDIVAPDNTATASDAVSFTNRFYQLVLLP
ncbi:MAG: hypothetical protein DME18_07455 [Verrucomicrobia bacterium]|nr:MAG: hypothetical protein DME18_07455 [Verrucomicrobiota bacterium]